MLRGHPSHPKVQPLAVQRDYLHFSVIHKDLELVTVPGIEAATSRCEVKRSSDSANPARSDYP